MHKKIIFTIVSFVTDGASAWLVSLYCYCKVFFIL